MQRDRKADIRNQQQENKKLELQTKKMEQQLERIKKIKEIENEKLRLRKQLQALSLQNKELLQPKVQIKKEEDTKLRDYGANLVKENQAKLKKKMKKFNNMMAYSSSSEEEQGTGQNLQYFLKMMGMGHHFKAFYDNKISSLPQLRNLKQGQLKAMNVSVKDHVKIIKKIRQMGF